MVTTSNNTAKNQGIRATRTVKTDRLGKQLKLNRKRIRVEVRDTIKYNYERKGTDLICWNNNGPVIIISKVRANLPLTSVKL